MSLTATGRRRQEGGEKVTGATRFTADIELPGLLHVHLVVAHFASARIRGVETAAARSLPGVVDVITGRDLPELERAGPDLPLATDRVFYTGQPVVAVVAETEAIAADAAALVEVDYEEADPVVAATSPSCSTWLHTRCASSRCRSAEASAERSSSSSLCCR